MTTTAATSEAFLAASDAVEYAARSYGPNSYEARAARRDLEAARAAHEDAVAAEYTPAETSPAALTQGTRVERVADGAPGTVRNVTADGVIVDLDAGVDVLGSPAAFRTRPRTAPDTSPQTIARLLTRVGVPRVRSDWDHVTIPTQQAERVLVITTDGRGYVVGNYGRQEWELGDLEGATWHEFESLTEVVEHVLAAEDEPVPPGTLPRTSRGSRAVHDDLGNIIGAEDVETTYNVDGTVTQTTTANLRTPPPDPGKRLPAVAAEVWRTALHAANRAGAADVRRWSRVYGMASILAPMLGVADPDDIDAIDQAVTRATTAVR